MGEVIDDIRVEVQLPPAEGDNLLTNTSGQYGAWQWSNATNVTDVSIVGDSVARTIKATRGATAGLTAIWTDHVPVTPGRYANARVDLTAMTSGHKTTLGLQFYNAAGAVISNQYSSPATTLTTLAFSSVTVPANAVSVRLLVILDKTADPLPNSGSANAGASVTFTRAMIAELTTAGVPSIVATNLMPNGGFQHVTTGWVSGTNIASIGRVDTGGGAYVLRAESAEVTLSDNERLYVNSPYVPIEAGQNYSIRVDVRADVMTDGHSLTPGLLYRWVNDAGTVIGGDNFLDSTVTTGAWVQFWRIITAPAGATKLRFHPYMKHHGPTILLGAGWDFDVDSVSVVKSSVLMPYWDGDTPDTSSYTYAWTGTVGNSPATRTSVGAVDYNEPDEAYLRIDAGVLSGKIERSELDVSTLQLQLFDAALSPAAADSVIAPGRGIRVDALRADEVTWFRKFTGEIGPCIVEYDPLEDERNGSPNITLSAVGAESMLAQVSRPTVTRTPANLTTLVLAGAGVPWDVDGNHGTVAGVVGIATIDDATALDQVALTRDTQNGPAYAWVNPEGLLVFRSTLGAKSTGPATMGPDDYMGEGLEVSFSTERLINSVTIKRIIRASDGSTEERTHGPYENLASIRRWGRRSQEVTIASVPDDVAQADTRGAAILASNATPVIIVESVQVNSGDDRTHAFHDLYDLITVTVDTIDGTVEQEARVVSIVDEFAAEREGGRRGTWYTAYGFMGEGGIASPSIQPSPTSTTDPGSWTTFAKASPTASMVDIVVEYRITGNLIEWRTSGNTAAAISVPASGDITNQNITQSIPGSMRPELGNWAWVLSLASNSAYLAITPGGTLTLFAVEGTGTALTIPSGSALLGQSPAFVLPSSSA